MSEQTLAVYVLHSGINKISEAEIEIPDGWSKHKARQQFQKFLDAIGDGNRVLTPDEYAAWFIESKMQPAHRLVRIQTLFEARRLIAKCEMELDRGTDTFIDAWQTLNNAWLYLSQQERDLESQQ